MNKLIIISLLVASSVYAVVPIGFFARKTVVAGESGSGFPTNLPINNIAGITSTDSFWSYSLQSTSKWGQAAIRVREAAGNIELDINWVSTNLDTATMITFAAGTNLFVVNVYDQIWTNYQTQATAANQPMIYNGTAFRTNEAGVVMPFFDGSNDELTSAVGVTNTSNFTYLSWSSSTNASPATATFFIKSEYTGDAGMYYNAGTWTMNCGAGTVSLVDANTYASKALHLWTIVCSNGVNVTTWHGKSGLTYTNVNAATPLGADATYVQQIKLGGNAFQFIGSVWGSGRFNKAMSSNEQALFFNYPY